MRGCSFSIGPSHPLANAGVMVSPPDAWSKDSVDEASTMTDATARPMTTLRMSTSASIAYQLRRSVPEPGRGSARRLAVVHRTDDVPLLVLKKNEIADSHDLRSFA